MCGRDWSSDVCSSDLPLGWVLMFPAGMGVQGMWVSFIVALSMAALLFLVRFHRLQKLFLLNQK